jgi:hypothetical protein
MSDAAEHALEHGLVREEATGAGSDLAIRHPPEIGV